MFSKEVTMCIDSISAFSDYDDYLQDSRNDGHLVGLCSKVALALNHRHWLSEQATPLCSNGHFAKYAVIDRTKASDDPARIVHFLCEFHGCPFEALTYQAKALLPHQFILSLIYLKDRK